jgi:hypothetical protein
VNLLVLRLLFDHLPPQKYAEEQVHISAILQKVLKNSHYDHNRLCVHLVHEIKTPLINILLQNTKNEQRFKNAEAHLRSRETTQTQTPTELFPLRQPQEIYGGSFQSPRTSITTTFVVLANGKIISYLSNKLNSTSTMLVRRRTKFSVPMDFDYSSQNKRRTSKYFGPVKRVGKYQNLNQLSRDLEMMMESYRNVGKM